MSEQQQNTREAAIERVHKAIENAVNGYECQYTRECQYTHDLDIGESSGLRLVDMLTPPDEKDVTFGKEEVALLIDAIQGDVADVIGEVFDAGAASIDRVEIVREAFEQVKLKHEELEETEKEGFSWVVFEAMDAVLTEMEGEGK